MLLQFIKKIYVYSDGELTHRLMEDIFGKLDNIQGIIVKDKTVFSKSYIYYNREEIDNNENNLIIITPVYAFDEIRKSLNGFKGTIISIEEIINKLEQEE